MFNLRVPTAGILRATTFAVAPSPAMTSELNTRRSSRLAAVSARAVAASRAPQEEIPLSKEIIPRPSASFSYTWTMPVIRCKLLKRYKRFLADVQLPGSLDVVTVHCPNPGSMHGLRVDAEPDALVSKAPPGTSRKLDYTLEAIFVDSRTLVGCNTSLPNNVVGAWLASAPEAKAIFGEFTSIRREVVYGIDSRSRIDFVLDYGPADGLPASSPPLPSAAPYYVEVKNVTMAWDDGDTRVAVFPDSKTVRGLKHLRELVDVVNRKAARACVLYFVNRQDCSAFAPCTIDPKYMEGFHEAERAGVLAVPLVFGLEFDDQSPDDVKFVYTGRLPIHSRSGP
jgi:sugar fermentation stimulation protein A